MQRLNYLPVWAGGGGGGGAFCWQALRRAEAATRVRIAIFMFMCVGVNRLILVPIHQTPGSGTYEINDKFCLCKQPNKFVAKMITKGVDMLSPIGRFRRVHRHYPPPRHLPHQKRCAWAGSRFRSRNPHRRAPPLDVALAPQILQSNSGR